VAAGFDFARPPHPRALSIVVTPLLSGGTFLVVFAYSHPALTERFFALEHTGPFVRAAALLFVSFVTGSILEGVVVFPFIFLTLSFGALATGIRIRDYRSRSKTWIRASARATFRRSATVLLGEAVVPESAKVSAADSRVEQALRLRTVNDRDPVIVPSSAKLKVERLPISAPDSDPQWRDIYRALLRLQREQERDKEHLPWTFEAILSVAAPIVVAPWLSYDVPTALHRAAVLACVYVGVVLIVSGIMITKDQMDPDSLQSFLFAQILARSAGIKESLELQDPK